MRRFVIVAIIGLLLSCSKKDGYVIQGDIEGLSAPIDIYMLEAVGGKYVAMDSARSEDGHFEFRGTFTYPKFIYLRLGKDQKVINFYAENAEINIKSDINDLSETVVRGSDINDQLTDYTEMLQPYDDEYNNLVQQYRQAQSEGNTAAKDRVLQDIDALDARQTEKIYEFLGKDVSDFLKLFIIENYLSYKLDSPGLDSLLSAIDPAARLTPGYERLAERLTVLRRVAVGQPALHFALEDPSGDPVPLSNFEGKYLLIDFWASWCQPCREENPKVVKLYEEFNDRGFEILGVSLDQSRERWLSAIEQDGLTWAHVSDLQGWQSAAGRLYGVNAIPHTVLINPEGMIIAKNLKTEELRERLNELLAKGNT